MTYLSSLVLLYKQKLSFPSHLCSCNLHESWFLSFICYSFSEKIRVCPDLSRRWNLWSYWYISGLTSSCRWSFIFFYLQTILACEELKKKMSKSMELPDCVYPRPPVTIFPCAPTPKHSLHLSNLDSQKFFRFSVKYVHLFEKCVSVDVLKSSLSRVLVDYYPLAGRLRRSSISEDDHKLQVDCNGEGAVFAEAFMDATAQQLLQPCNLPNTTWKKLLCKVEAQSFLDLPPLIIQVR